MADAVVFGLLAILLLYKIFRLIRQMAWTWRRADQYIEDRLALRASGAG